MKNLFKKDGMELGNVNPAFQNDFGQTDNQKPVNGVTTVAAQVDKVGAVEAGEEEDGPKRQQWSNGIEFLMSCIAMSVGLGNIWRFPYTAFNNGGGAFLIPYIIVLLVIGKPLYYMEMSLGQFISGGPIKVWNLSPALKDFPNSKSLFLLYSKTVLKEADNLDDGIGVPDWKLTLCLLFAWVTIFLVIIKGVKSSGKAAYFLALFPYVVMITLLIRGATLPGAVDGILYFVKPKWEELLNPTVWYNAVTQAFFSLNICFGTLVMYSSYNDFHHNVYRDALIVTTLDTFTSLLAGCTIFSILGNLMHELDIKDSNIKDVVQGGTGLAFVSYPDAIAKFDVVPQFFSVVFFLMLYTLGIGSAVALAGAVITIICDRFPNLKYWTVALGTCICGFLVGLVYITPGGQYVLTLVDFYGANFTVFILGTIEMVGIAWIYGFDNLCSDLEFMLKRKAGPYWRLCWGIITPVLMIVILVYAMVIMEPEKYKDQFFPDSAYAGGWVLFAFGVLQFPLWAGVAIYRNIHHGLLKAIKISFQPSEEWRPVSNKISREWKAFRDERQAELDHITRENIWQKFVRLFFGRITARSTANGVANGY
ncbi:Sodium-dependent nutrient amino acid transporter 1 [Blattella germanica]|nr:Sodium-dependent nutrient amino acid transporter 1 [Blattella germanica]